jgi:hypothetical protein
MKKFILLLSLIALFCQSANAQTGGLNFQGVARNSTGAVLANQKINLKFSILKTTETGAVEYTETKEVTTNAQGIFAVVVGEVNASSFAAVDWKASPKFLKVEMDPAGGTSFASMGTTRLQNVPYAYYANGVNANNIDGTISVAKGGTGATDAAAARTNLGLVIGTNVQAPLTAGTDYLTPSGNAATATKLAAAKKINGVDFDGSTDISITATADASTLSGTVALAKGGTGASTAADARANLGLVIGTNVQAPLTAGTDYLTPTGNAATATKLAVKKKINGIDFDGSNDITIPMVTDASTLSGTVSIAKGGTGATSAATALTNLGAESIANKSTDITADASSLTKYPSVKTVKDYVDTRVITGVSTSTDLNISRINGLVLGRGNGTNISSVAIGNFALSNNSDGDNNVAVGYQALRFNATGDYNSAVGVFALGDNFNGSLNTAIGLGSLRYNDGNNNSAVGVYALNRNTTGSDNVGLGKESGILNTIGSNNTFLGSYSNAGSNNLTNTTAIGNGAIVSASNTIQLGNSAIIDVKTSGTLTAGEITYPKTHGSSGQVLTTTGSGILTWTSISVSNVADASTLSGTIAIAKGGTGATNATTALTNLGAESTANKSTNITLDANSLTKYPSVKTIKDYVDTRVITGVSSSTDLTITSVNGLQLGRGTGSNTSNNIAVGASVLLSNTTGRFNTASGNQALQSNTIGDHNTASGYQALRVNGTGYGNTASGSFALRDNTTGGHNTASGYEALIRNTIGNNNTASGSYALELNITGNFNTASGTNALSRNTTGEFNTASGHASIFSNTTGNYNTASGSGALILNTTGGKNTAIGYQAGSSVTTGANNTFIGSGSDALSNNLSNATAIGNGAIVSASNTVQLGNTAITDVKTSGAITAAGYKTPTGTSSQYLMADGTVSSGVASATSINGLELGRGAGSNPSNVAVGANALRLNTTGVNNTASGLDALQSNTTGFNNTASGAGALSSNTIGIYNTANGVGALSSNTIGSFNTASGFSALFFNTGSSNTAIGHGALLDNTTGNANTASGAGALQKNTTGSNNTASGSSALFSNTTGVQNTAIGYQAGSTNTEGNNNIYIGNGSTGSSATISNTINLGNSSITTLRAQVTSITSLSDKRDKTDIVNISEGLDFVKKLRPVSFTWNTRDKAKVGIKSAGFIAQELLALQKGSNIGDNLDLVSQDNPERLEARYNNLLPVLVKAIQEVNEAKDKELHQLKAEKDKEIDELKSRIQSLEELVNKVLENKKP